MSTSPSSQLLKVCHSQPSQSILKMSILRPAWPSSPTSWDMDLAGGGVPQRRRVVRHARGRRPGAGGGGVEDVHLAAGRDVPLHGLLEAEVPVAPD
mmetsp:Transcript_105241/g.329146  ORF Transcript_105241/g.329146 Transcript_105241/m.329146 type:complete len:96 (-) Transcript_105241:556-843(-)